MYSIGVIVMWSNIIDLDKIIRNNHYSKDTMSFLPIPEARASSVAMVGLQVPFSILLMLD